MQLFEHNMPAHFALAHASAARSNHTHSVSQSVLEYPPEPQRSDRPSRTHLATHTHTDFGMECIQTRILRHEALYFAHTNDVLHAHDESEFTDGVSAGSKSSLLAHFEHRRRRIVFRYKKLKRCARANNKTSSSSTRRHDRRLLAHSTTTTANI